jgi:putative transposase
MVRRAYRFQLYRTKRLRHLHAQIDLGAEIYNHCIALQKRYYRRYKGYIGYLRLKRHVTRLKQWARFAHWSGLGSQAIQNIVWRIDQGYQKFFRQENRRPPTFRKRHKYHSFTLTQAGWKYLGGNRLTIAGRLYKLIGCGPVHTAASRMIESATPRAILHRKGRLPVGKGTVIPPR